MYGNARHPMIIRWKMCADREGRIQAIDTTSYVDAGCSEDFSGFIAGEMLENIEGVYQTPHCESHLPLEFASVDPR